MEGMLPAGLAQRLASQLDCVALIVRDIPPERLTRRAAPEKWSAHENLAHLARYQRMFLDDRIPRILNEERPEFLRYRSEDDPEWPRWRGMTLEQTLTELTAGRRVLAERIASCSDRELARVGVHPAFGAMTLSEWVEFFLIHDAHHLYIALTRARA
jgi:DinB family protein